MGGTYEGNRRDFYDAISLRQPKEIPVGISAKGWPFSYSGVRFDDLIRAGEVQKIADSYLKFFKDAKVGFECSCMLPASLEMHKALYEGSFSYSEDGNSVIYEEPIESIIGPEAYDRMASGFLEFQKEERGRHPIFHLPTKEEAYEALKNAVIANKTHCAASSLINSGLYSLGVFSVENDMPFQRVIGPSSVFSSYRGKENFLKDLEEIPDKVYSACDALFESCQQNFTADENPNKECVILFGSKEELSLADEAFDRLYFSHMRDEYMPFALNGAKIIAKVESPDPKALERYKCFPEGSVLFICENMDQFEAYKKAEGWAALASNVPKEILKGSSRAECLEYVKRSFGEFAPKGGFAFMVQCSPGLDTANTFACYEAALELSKR